MRQTRLFNIENPVVFKQKLLIWSQQFREIVFLDSNSENSKNQLYSTFDFLFAVDAFTSIKTDSLNAFEDLKQYQQTTNDWIFGYLTYDLKNDIEKLQSNNFDGLGFDDLFFFQPKKIVSLYKNKVSFDYLNLCEEEIQLDFLEIENQILEFNNEPPVITIEQRISKDEYINNVSKILEDISYGKVYETNFCMEFYAENAILNPLATYFKLNAISKAPFSVFFKNNKHFLLSASPERYLKKLNETIISQPIKGTAKRGNDISGDLKLKSDLENNPKELSENIMIADLVRNDLSRTAQKGSVKVEELCKIYSYLQVHQMITTITSAIDSQFSVIDAIKTTFPMGSMTGAPKIAAMKIIENLETTKRGLYSGAVGYFSPNCDFDFNVVIRSILYNEERKYVSFSVGSAITSGSIPENEYEECLLKAKAMMEVLGNKF